MAGRSVAGPDTGNTVVDEDLAAQVKVRDRERWLSVQWAPADLRPALFAVHALDLELQHVVASARESMLAEIRLAWWREQLENMAAGQPVPAEPLLQALARDVQSKGVDLAALAGIEAGLQPLLEGHDVQPLQVAEARGQPLFAALMRIMCGRELSDAEAQAVRLAGTRWALSCLWRGGWGRAEQYLQKLDPPAFPAKPERLLPAPLATLDALAADDWGRMQRGKALRRIASPVRQWKMAHAALTSR